MQFSLSRLLYFVTAYCLVLGTIKLAPECLDYPALYAAAVLAIFGALYYELSRHGCSA
jgi:hypothetical protein